MKNNFTVKRQSNIVPFVAIVITATPSFFVTKNREHLRHREPSILSTVSYSSNEESISMLFSSSLKDDFFQQDIFSFLDFLDDNLSDDNIVIADEEQLMRIASLVDGVDFE